jgi:hypothetical protein
MSKANSLLMHLIAGTSSICLIETFAEAKARALMIDGRFPVASLDGIIASKRAANRPKGRESLPRLEAFRDYLRRRNLPALPTNPSQR